LIRERPEFHRHKRVEKIRDAARMQGEFFSDFCASERCCPSVVNKPKSTAVSKTLEFQKPKAVWRIASGVGANVVTKTTLPSGTYGYKFLVNGTDAMFELGTRPLRLNKRELTDALLVFKPVDD
jgi:hypothetical protein